MYCETIMIGQKTQQRIPVLLICFIKNENLPLPTKLQLTKHQMITDIKPFLFIFEKSTAYFDCKLEDQCCFVYPNTLQLSRNLDSLTKRIIETFKCGAFKLSSSIASIVTGVLDVGYVQSLTVIFHLNSLYEYHHAPMTTRNQDSFYISNVKVKSRRLPNFFFIKYSSKTIQR